MEGNGYDGRWMVVVSREMDGSWEWYNEMGQGNEGRGRVMEGKFGGRFIRVGLGVVLG